MFTFPTENVSTYLCIRAYIHTYTSGVFLTAAILGSGLGQFNSGNKGNQQLFMRARVMAQGATVSE